MGRLPAVGHQLTLGKSCISRPSIRMISSKPTVAGCRIRCIVLAALAALAAHAVGGDELGGHHAHGVAERGELPGTVVGAGTGFHTDQARRQTGDQYL